MAKPEETGVAFYTTNVHPMEISRLFYASQEPESSRLEKLLRPPPSPHLPPAGGQAMLGTLT